MSEPPPQQQQQHSSQSEFNMKRESKATLWFLRFCQLLSVATLLTNGLGAFLNVVFLQDAWESNEEFAFAFVALRLYSLFLCLLALCGELESTAKLISTHFGFMQTWVGKGLVTMFNGVLFITCPAHFTDLRAIKPWIGLLLLGVGLVYFTCGIACLHRIKESHMNKLRRRDQVRKEKAELESRKHEIEALLRDTESQLEKI
ncbi:hypothetical protein BASA82_001118 [Batrachochytrium salamandrivorans]|nr:hypothetical protein BASA81_004962 [Batrachochytrium salamandrivorans]KAH9260532.1 hypothetical protein BASA82_001118 [Batrachochytrium salamandrivorans]